MRAIYLFFIYLRHSFQVRNVSYLINSLGLFTTAVFLNGIGILEFWAGETNLLEATDNAFFPEAGLVSINARNGTNIRGTFEGATHTGQGSFSRKIRNE